MKYKIITNEGQVLYSSKYLQKVFTWCLEQLPTDAVQNEMTENEIIAAIGEVGWVLVYS